VIPSCVESGCDQVEDELEELSNREFDKFEQSLEDKDKWLIDRTVPLPTRRLLHQSLLHIRYIV